MTASTELPTASVLIVDDEPGMRSYLSKALASRFALIETADSLTAAEALRQRLHFDLLLVDIRLPDRSGIEWHEALGPERRSDIIFMTAYADLDIAVKALRAGASDFIIKPFRLEQLQSAVDRCLAQRRLARENFVLKREAQRLHSPDESMIGDSQAMARVRTIIERVAPTPSAVLIYGESGTGKELVARDLHRLSGRFGAFVPLNCGAIAGDLLESELFGHTKGAFTGAVKTREGLFTYADGGTLFLDEIAEMPLAMQAKLLRVLESKRIRPVGSEQEQPVDVRIVAATHRNLQHEVNEGRFREDLYFRLNVLTLPLPALRERPEDIPALAHHFSRQLSRDLGLDALPWQHADLERLTHYSWPGNIRELKNFIERCILLGQLPSDMFDDAVVAETDLNADGYPTDWTLDAVERAHILNVLDAHANNKSSAARALGVSRKTLDRKLTAWQDLDA
ncbi:sigma-54-dependent transcriptional regulator [Chromohalobacter israelensis]|uniref:sigma-54-dependent transcriptional regulator n=1 Tax=Chromohalobacter israelensis TaxID=141390 RepID=UPI000D7092D8|nr:sigma-54 dependent transcriptional regulator [Chromohalobacter salexigens]MBZ5874796.1 sigma-54 dependent transcriptional regulator [Chromohalobacter salexigens]PWW41766.1 two component Fis family sigma54 specific transcriptional regulator [Chromohalobacter salexigens]RXE48526.1 sigma-54-dependent Fis family transcriptional regulator [Chromohalobacter salexigens]